MPKKKTHKGTAKRVKLTKREIVHQSPNKTHFQEKKSARRKRAINAVSTLSGANKRNVKRALGV